MSDKRKFDSTKKCVTGLFRQDGQGTRDEYKGKDYRGDLEERERVALRERTKERARRCFFLRLDHSN